MLNGGLGGVVGSREGEGKDGNDGGDVEDLTLGGL